MIDIVPLISCCCWRLFSLSITNRFSLQISFIPITSFFCQTFYLLVFFSNLTTNIEIKKMLFTGKLNLPHIKRTKTRKNKKTATGSLWYKNVVGFPWFEWYSSSFVGKINCLARYHYQKAVGYPISRFNPATRVPVPSQDLDYQRLVIYFAFNYVK